MKKVKMYVAELRAKRYFGRQNHSGFKSKLDNPMGDKDLITWVWVHPIVLDMLILGIPQFLVAGVGENTQHRSHLPSYARSLDICAKPFRNSILCQTNL